MVIKHFKHYSGVELYGAKCYFSTFLCSVQDHEIGLWSSMDFKESHQNTTPKTYPKNSDL
jgi:hypothetical protein